MAENCAPGEHKIRSCSIKGRIDQEVFLLPAKGGDHLVHVFHKIPADLNGGLIHRTQRPQQRGLEIQGFSRIGNKDRWDTKGLIHYEGRGSRVPGCVAPGLERIPDATAREARGIGFLLDKLVGVEILYGCPFVLRYYESIVLFGSCPGKRMEPVSIMGGPFVYGPRFHGGSHLVGYLALYPYSLFNRIDHHPISLLRQVFAHYLPVEGHLTIVI